MATSYFEEVRKKSEEVGATATPYYRVLAYTCKKRNMSQQCSHQANFFQRISDLLEQGQTIFGNIVNKALENSTNLWKYDIWYTLILDWFEI